MNESVIQDNKALIEFWDQALSISDEEKEELKDVDPASYLSLAPSPKLADAVKSLCTKKKVLDYGCGNGWASIIIAKSGCGDVTSFDVAHSAVAATKAYAEAYKATPFIHPVFGDGSWLQKEKAETYDALVCSNVLDVVPEETCLSILKQFSRVLPKDGLAIIGLNFYLSSEEATKREMNLVDGKRLYVNGVLRLVSRSDEEWAELFSPYFEVLKLEHFAWPGEKEEKRRLFYLKKRG